MKLENEIKDQLLLSSPEWGILWRNNVGACRTENRVVRFGLANESKRQNELLKSGDNIGITRKVITPDMVGQTIGVFTSVETKREGWVYKGTAREKAQLNWIRLVRKHGGIADFFNGEWYGIE